MTIKQEFAHALSGKPEAVSKNTPKVVYGYIIRDMMGFLYTTNTTLQLNKWREIMHESDLFWVISERLNPLVPTQYLLYKNKEIAEEHMRELR